MRLALDIIIHVFKVGVWLQSLHTERNRLFSRSPSVGKFPRFSVQGVPNYFFIALHSNSITIKNVTYFEWMEFKSHIISFWCKSICRTAFITLFCVPRIQPTLLKKFLIDPTKQGYINLCVNSNHLMLFLTPLSKSEARSSSLISVVMESLFLENLKFANV